LIYVLKAKLKYLFRSRDISKIFASDGVFTRSVYFGMGSAQLFQSAHMHPRKNHTLSIRKIVII